LRGEEATEEGADAGGEKGGGGGDGARHREEEEEERGARHGCTTRMGVSRVMHSLAAARGGERSLGSVAAGKQGRGGSL
jgi:hypothetical protein